MRIIKCRKCRKRLFDIDDKDIHRIWLKTPSNNVILIDCLNGGVDGKESLAFPLEDDTRNIVYMPEKEAVKYQCPRCKIHLCIRLRNGYMEENITK